MATQQELLTTLANIESLKKDIKRAIDGLLFDEDGHATITMLNNLHRDEHAKLRTQTLKPVEV